jgi:hypothetical protein
MTRKYTWLEAIPYLAALISCAPLIVGGFPQGHDWTFELARVAEFSHALSEGQFPPHWAPNLYGGYGSPVFLFYAPAFVALASAASNVFGSAAAGASAVLVLFSFIGVFAVRRLFDVIPGVDPQGGRIAATVFALHPYLIGDKLIRNANAEFAALCLLPLALVGLMRLGGQPLRGAFVVAGALAASILSHNLTALICLALLLGGTLWLYGWRKAARIQLALASGVAVGLLIAAFVWLPALTLRDAIQIGELTRGKFDFHNQWKPFSEFFGYTRAFSSGALAPVALLLAGGWLAVRRFGDAFAGRRFLLGLLTAALIFIGLQFRLSTPLWEGIPWLRFMQFPWRFMGPLALVTAVAAGIVAVPLLSRCSNRARMGVEAAVFALCVANAWPNLADYEPLSALHAKTIVKAIQPDKLRRGALNVSVLDEYLPRGARPAVWKREAAAGGRTVLATQPEAQFEVLVEKGSRISLDVDAPTGTRLRLARWHFPGWEAELDGAPIPIESNRVGGIDVQIPAPGGTFELVHRPPRSRRMGLALSGLGVGLWLALYFAQRRQRSAE